MQFYRIFGLFCYSEIFILFEVVKIHFTSSVHVFVFFAHVQMLTNAEKMKVNARAPVSTPLVPLNVDAV